MLSLATVFAMSAISVFTGIGVASLFETLVGDDTSLKRLGLIAVGATALVSTVLFLLVHIK